MTLLRNTIIFSIVTSATVSGNARSECTAGQVCVDREDLKDMMSVLKAQRCLRTDKPEFVLDPITVFTDVNGRLFVTGSSPYPWKLHMKWCSIEAEAEGTVKVLAVKMLPPEYGFRLRPKVWIGYLPREALDAKDTGKGIDAGAMLDFAYWKWVNLNASLGIRSGGLGLGADLTSNFGVYIGWATAWDGWNQNVNAAIWFGF